MPLMYYDDRLYFIPSKNGSIFCKARHECVILFNSHLLCEIKRYFHIYIQQKTALVFPFIITWNLLITESEVFPLNNEVLPQLVKYSACSYLFEGQVMVDSSL